MRFTLAVIALVASGLIGQSWMAPPAAAQADSEILPGCSIPRSYGRLVTMMAGSQSGLAGNAVFEAEDGTIRWVPFMFHSTQVIMPKPARRAVPANFPMLPLYECTTGHVWQRH